MSDYSEIEFREVDPRFKSSMARVEKLLTSCNLKYERLDYMCALFDSDDAALACGGYDGSTVKCVAVSPENRGDGLSNMIISRLLGRLISEGKENISVFTKPENESMFSSFGFELVERADAAIFMERGRLGIKDYAESLSRLKKDGLNGAIVMNCNPFTNGHLFLAEYAAGMCDNLYVFVVREDRSVFPFDVRFDLVKKGLSHLENVTVLDGGPYIISNAVFPSYFLKEYSDVTKAHAQIDVRIFARYVAPALNIKRRFVGEELTDRVTSEYNRAMEDILPAYGLDSPYIVARKRSADGQAISASSVRRGLAEGNFEKIKDAVPETTYEFLVSDGCRDIIAKIKKTIS